MTQRMIVVANRLPVHRTAAGWETSPGGLVSALTPILQEHEGLWVGWSGDADDDPGRFQHDGIELHPVPLSESEVADYYLGFSNATVWPLYHDAIRTPEFHRTWWRSYRAINRRFADTVAATARPGDVVWIQDYHLQLVPAMLRDAAPGVTIAFYLHIPFPPVEIFARMPWRRQVTAGLLGADLVGFQTELAVHNFREAASRFGDGYLTAEAVRHPGGDTSVLAAPISIEYDAWDHRARAAETKVLAERLYGELGNPRKVLLGVDRLDYTKGIDVRLRAFETLLARRPDLGDDVMFVQIAVPSRERIGDYEQMREEIERIVGRISGVQGGRHRMPVHYVYGSLTPDELAAYYSLADVMCVTPLADGMNLVAKEYVASRIGEDGVLVLSEFAGAARELNGETGALLVNPYDIDGVAAALEEALELGRESQVERMRTMRTRVRNHDVHRWAAEFLEAAIR